MAFQFQCPQGHLLEGDETQAGQTINCPVCGMLFIIPEPIPVPATVESSAAAPPTPEEAPDPELLHIPCPNGHELEVPPDMLEAEVLCPQCSVQFRLRSKNSVEFRRRREKEREVREAKTNKFWLNFAIGVAVAVVLLLLTLMIMSAVSQSTPDRQPRPTRPPGAVEETTTESNDE